MPPQFQLNTPYQDSRNNEIYYIQERQGYYWKCYARGGNPENIGPVNNTAQAGPEQTATRSTGITRQQPRHIPHNTGNGLQQGQLQQSPQFASPPSSANYRIEGAFSDPNATPRAANAFPRSLEEGFQTLSIKTSQATQTPPAAATSYQGYHYARDGNGTTIRTANGPPEWITDPSLQRESIYAAKMLFETPGTEEKLDPSFKQRTNPRHFFKVGKVFLVLWAEPSGQVNASNASEVTTGRYQQLVHSKIRRFVVVREGSNYCSAVQISTYQGYGVSKPGVRKSDHAIIHTSRQPPPALPVEAPVRGEEGMRAASIRVDPFEPQDRSSFLHPVSRVNFGKVYTIEHHLKVKGLGMVVSINELVYQFRDVWNSHIPQGPSPLAYMPQATPGGESSRTRTRDSQYESNAASGASRLTNQHTLRERQQAAARRQLALRQQQRQKLENGTVSSEEDDSDDGDEYEERS